MDDFPLNAESIAQMRSPALFETLSDLSMIWSVGTGTILYDPRFDRDSKLSESLRAVAIASSLGRKSIDSVRKEYADHEFDHNTDPARVKYVQAYRHAQAYVDCSLSR